MAIVLCDLDARLFGAFSQDSAEFPEHLVGISIRSSPLTPPTACRRSAKASRCPSVATIDALSGFNSSRTPFRENRFSSCDAANIVLSINPASTAVGSVNAALGSSGKAGKLSVAMLANLNEDRWQVSCTQWFSKPLKRISPSGSDLTISTRRRAGTAAFPSAFTLAKQLVRAASSRSLAVICNLEPVASMRKWERMSSGRQQDVLLQRPIVARRNQFCKLS